MPEKQFSTQNPHPADKLAGARLRQVRLEHGLSQEKLAEMLGITFQQIQKYENGTNRLSVSRIHEIARHLAVDAGVFFNPQMDDATGAKAYLKAAEAKPAPLEFADQLKTREAIELLKALQQLTNPADRKKLVELAKQLVKAAQAK